MWSISTSHTQEHRCKIVLPAAVRDLSSGKWGYLSISLWFLVSCIAAFHCPGRVIPLWFWKRLLSPPKQVLACTLLLLTRIYHLISKLALSLIPTSSYLAKLTPFLFSRAQSILPLRCVFSILFSAAALLILPGSCLSCPVYSALNMIV